MAEKEEQKRKAFEKKRQEDEKKVEQDNIQEHINQLQRIQAEFENYKKRMEKEKEYHSNYAKADLIKDLLPILDSFDLALKAIEDKKAQEGIRLVHSQLQKVMENEGVKAIESQGALDPFKHEVVLQKESEKEDGEILEEVQKGYLLKDKVLRTSKVIVSKNSGGK